MARLRAVLCVAVLALCLLGAEARARKKKRRAKATIAALPTNKVPLVPFSTGQPLYQGWDLVPATKVKSVNIMMTGARLKVRSHHVKGLPNHPHRCVARVLGGRVACFKLSTASRRQANSAPGAQRQVPGILTNKCLADLSSPAPPPRLQGPTGQPTMLDFTTPM